MNIGGAVLLKITSEKQRKSLVKKCRNILNYSKPTKYLSTLYGDNVRRVFPMEWLFPTILTEFENQLHPVPADADKYLTKSYGDYMKLPPVEQRKYHHDFMFLDLNNSYKNYKGKYFLIESKDK